MNLPDSIQAKFGKKRERYGTPEFKNMVDRIRAYLPGTAGFTSEYPEKGVPTQVLADDPAGLIISPTRENSSGTYYCTALAVTVKCKFSTRILSAYYKIFGVIKNVNLPPQPG